MLHGVKARAFCECPSGKNSLGGAIEQEFIHFDKGRCERRLRRGARVACSWRYLQRAESGGLPNAHLKRLDAARHFVERRKHGDGILNSIGLDGKRSAKL
jgi:hypothetical protein